MIDSSSFVWFGDQSKSLKLVFIFILRTRFMYQKATERKKNRE